MRKHQSSQPAPVQPFGLRLEGSATKNLCWIVLLATPTIGHTKSKNFIEEMSTMEVSAALKAWKTIILPVGGTE